jgi:hypothetical protein
MNATVSKLSRVLKPRTADVKYTGIEPEWTVQPVPDNRQSRLIGAFSWYNYHFGKKDAKELTIDWLVHTGKTDQAKAFARVPDHINLNTVGWLCRMEMRGLILDQRESSHIQDTIDIHVDALRSEKLVAEDPVPMAPKITIQDRLQDIACNAAADLEGMYDDLIRAAVKITADSKPMAVLRGHNIAPPLVRDVKDRWQSRHDQLSAVIAGTDAQLMEGYANFSRTQLKTLLKFVDLVLANCDSYVQVKKTERTPRKKKPVSPERLTHRFPYLKEFPELKLKSEPVTKLVNATEAWLYDSKKRKLIHVMADSHVGSFTVKGTSIIGLDAVATTQKTLRKPEEQLKLVQTAAAAARKAYKDIKSTEVKWSGRGNENLILLRIR